MSNHEQLATWAEETDSLAEYIQRADAQNIPTEIQAEGLVEHVWGGPIPRDRAVAILEQERERLGDYDDVSLTESSRAPRYMDLADLELVSGYEFEHILADILSRVEGEATVTDASGDQGVDVVWTRDNTTIGIQAKAYHRNNPVGNSAVQEIYTGVDVRDSEYSIDVPAVVTTSRYTTGAREAADNAGVRLYGRADLQEWLSEAELDAEMMGELLNDIR